MTPLRQRMIEDLQLRGLSEKTQEAYVRAVRQLSGHYGKSPDCITEEELRQYFLYLKNVKRASRSACTVALCGIKFFYQHTLRREWSTLDLVRSPREKKLPVVLSTAEVGRILECIRRQRYRVYLGAARQPSGVARGLAPARGFAGLWSPGMGLGRFSSR